MTSSMNKGIVIESNIDGTYNLFIDENKLIKPSSFVDENKLAKELVQRLYPNFEIFKQYYIKSTPSKDILLFSPSTALPASVLFDDFDFIINVDKKTVVDLKNGFLKIISAITNDDTNFKVYYSRSNFNKKK